VPQQQRNGAMKLASKVGLGAVALVAAAVLVVRLGGSGAAKNGLDAALNNLPPGWKATHGAVSYDALSGQAQVDDLVVTRDGEPFLQAGFVLVSGIEGATATTPPKRIGKIVVRDLSAKVYRHVGRWEMDGVEVANLRTVFDPAAYQNGKPVSTTPLKLIASVDASDVLVHVDLPPPPPGAKPRRNPKLTAVDAHIEHFHNDGISARQFAKAPANDSLQDWEFIADAARAFSKESSTAKEVTETLPGIGAISIGTASMGGYRDGRIARLDERDILFTSDGKPNTFSVAAISAKDVDLNKLIDSLPELAKPGGNGKLNTGVKIGQFDIDDLKANFEHAPLVTMASLNGATLYDADGTQNGTVTMRALKIITTGRPMKPQAKLALDRFGMADFTIDLDEAATYAPGNGHLDITKADVLFHDLGTLHMAMDADGLQNISGSGTDQLQAMKAVQLKSALLQWTDNSLVNRVFKVAAAQSGKSVDDLRATLALPIASLGMFLPDQPDAPAQVSAFLADPKQLTITLAPPQPVSLFDVAQASAQEKAALLGVRVKGD
jgi:hypothetical protein